MFVRVGVLSVLVLSGTASRNQRRTAGDVSHVYTFGAPHPSNPMLTTGDGGCFDGYRFTNWQDRFGPNAEDVVPTLLTFSSYNHPNVQTISLMDADNDDGENGIRSKWVCGDNPVRGNLARAALHDAGLYQSNMKRLPDVYSRAKEASAVGLNNSYIDNVDTVRSNLEGTSWNLVGTAFYGEDIAHLMQHESSLRCILTFEGSDSFSDWIEDAKIFRTEFCGLFSGRGNGAHVGFKNELMGIVSSTSYTTNIRNKLGKCHEVDAVGHSLGGAVAALFTACISSQNGSPDYNQMSWTKEAAQLIPASV